MEEKEARKWLDGLSVGVRRVLFALLTYGVLLIICFLAISPEQYDLSVGDVAPKTITASKDVEDTLTTMQRRESAAEAISPVYYNDETVYDDVRGDVEESFGELRAVRELGAQIKAHSGIEETAHADFSDEDIEQATSLLNGQNLSNYQIRTLMNATESDFENLYNSLIQALGTTYRSSIMEGQLNAAITSIQQIVAYNTRTDLWYNIALPTLRSCLRANVLIDQEATEQKRQEAFDAVEPIVYKQNQNIVVKGDRVSAEQIAVLDSLGLIRGNSFDLWLYVGAALALALIVFGVYLYVFLFEREMLRKGRNAIVMLISVVITVSLNLLVGRYVGESAMPVMLAAMLAANLLGKHEAYVVNLSVALLTSFLTVAGTSLISSQVLSVMMTTCIGGIVCIYMLRRNMTRMHVVLAGLLTGIVNFAVLVAIGALTSSNIVSIMTESSYAIVGSFAAAVLCVGLQPMMESAFNLVTPGKLVELSNPNQPLLRRLMIETPGTYHHSIVAANLAEAGAEAVGADALLARVGAYYHDIGKLIRPMYFKENQMGDNPHDKTDPRVSTAILTEHTRDGVELARKHHLPEPIIDMIRQHHGMTPVMFFYAKAVKEFGEEHVDIADFRYDGPKPQTAEAAILMLADTVEAAVRSIQDPTQEKISGMIRKLVRGKMEDGQLDECPLTFKDIGKICSAFETVLQGVHHQRIEYPDVKMPQNVAAHTEEKKQEDK